MADEMYNENGDAVQNNGGNGGSIDILDPRVQTGNPELDQLNARYLELSEQRDAVRNELRELVRQREQLAATVTWGSKVENMNDAELAAMEEAIRLRRANAQQVGTQGIESTTEVGTVQ